MHSWPHGRDRHAHRNPDRVRRAVYARWRAGAWSRVRRTPAPPSVPGDADRPGPQGPGCVRRGGRRRRAGDARRPGPTADCHPAGRAAHGGAGATLAATVWLSWASTASGRGIRVAAVEVGHGCTYPGQCPLPQNAGLTGGLARYGPAGGTGRVRLNAVIGRFRAHWRRPPLLATVCAVTASAVTASAVTASAIAGCTPAGRPVALPSRTHAVPVTGAPSHPPASPRGTAPALSLIHTDAADE